MRGLFLAKTQTRQLGTAPQRPFNLRALSSKALTFVLGGLTLSTAPLSLPADAATPAGAPAVSEVLQQQHRCSDTLQLRHANLKPAQLTQICIDLAALEQRFHQLLQTGHKPVAHDGNSTLRANI